MQLFYRKNNKSTCPYDLNYSLLEKLSNNMKKILDNELKLGNRIREINKGGFTNITDDHIFILLDFPFKNKTRYDLENVIYKDINDRHYWKAEYYDTVYNQTIVCPFEK